MKVKTSFKWNGNKKKGDMQTAIIRSLNRSGILVESRAKVLAPIDQGDLRGSISKRLIIEKLQMEISTNLQYAFYVEFGTGRFAENGLGRKTPWVYYNAVIGMYVLTSGVKAQPFMRPALYDNKQKVKSIFIEEGKKAI